MESIKIFLSIETFFRLIQCGFTQPLKLAIFMHGWQPRWLIRLTKYVGDLVTSYSSIGPREEIEWKNWLSKEVICSTPMHLDLTMSFGTAIFIVMCSTAR